MAIMPSVMTPGMFESHGGSLQMGSTVSESTDQRVRYSLTSRRCDMPNEDGFTIGELRRLQEHSLSEHGDINRRIDAVQREFLRRETFEIALGSIRMEITAMASDVKDVTEQLRVMKEQADQRARTMLALVVSAFVAPIVTALIVFWLTSGGTH
jgi:hypothetical protein